jgi:hypothetical protein
MNKSNAYSMWISSRVFIFNWLLSDAVVLRNVDDAIIGEYGTTGGKKNGRGNRSIELC